VVRRRRWQLSEAADAASNCEIRPDMARYGDAVSAASAVSAVSAVSEAGSTAAAAAWRRRQRDGRSCTIRID
jgi:hypothetical protein